MPTPSSHILSRNLLSKRERVGQKKRREKESF